MELTSEPTLRPSVSEAERRAGLLWMGAGVLAGGLLISLWTGLAALAALFALPAPPPGWLVLGLLMGGGLFREGWRMTQGEPDAPLPGAEASALGRTFILLMILIGCGAVAERWAPHLPLFILPFQIAVAVLGPLAWFNLLRWRLRAPCSRRTGWWGLSLGSLLTPALALVPEGLTLGGLALGLVILRVILEGPGFLTRWLPGGFPPPERLLSESLLADPWIWVGILIGTVLLVPFIEEALKPLPAILRVRDPRLSPSEMILYGALGGAGFALAENLLNGSLGGMWAPTAVGRLGATALHVWNGGLMGWAWGGLRRGRVLEAIGAYLLAGLLHGLWNAGAVALGGALAAPLSVEARALILPPALAGMGIAMLMVIGGLWWALPMLGEADGRSSA